MFKNNKTTPPPTSPPPLPQQHFVNMLLYITYEPSFKSARYYSTRPDNFGLTDTIVYENLTCGWLRV